MECFIDILFSWTIMFIKRIFIVVFFSESRLYCWGSWDEDEYKFVLIGAANLPAQYVMVSL